MQSIILTSYNVYYVIFGLDFAKNSAIFSIFLLIYSTFLHGGDFYSVFFDRLMVPNSAFPHFKLFNVALNTNIIYNNNVIII